MSTTQQQEKRFRLRVWRDGFASLASTYYGHSEAAAFDNVPIGNHPWELAVLEAVVDGIPCYRRLRESAD